ncbi:MAG: branched-chain amino acid ABC transporter permease [Motiliproteus sp.]
MDFFLEVLIAGLLSGVMYSLVALGFVLIFKASGVFNFAQGTMVLFAALAFVSLLESGINFWISMLLTFGIMVLLGLAIERVVLRPLINQSPITLLMVTIGLSFFLEGLAQALFGNQVHALDLGISDDPIFLADYWENAPDILISSFDIFAALTAGLLVAVLALFFNKTKHGRALRAVSDDPAAAQSVGIPLQHVTALVWAVAGFVALVAGLLWGSRLGVQFALSVIALKALPVLIIGGFTSITGAIVGGLLIGASEKLAELYVGEWFGIGGIENWFPYVLALVFLLFRPNGLFGESRINRV